jgi:hypothetical protein
MSKRLDKRQTREQPSAPPLRGLLQGACVLLLLVGVLALLRGPSKIPSDIQWGISLLERGKKEGQPTMAPQSSEDSLRTASKSLYDSLGEASESLEDLEKGDDPRPSIPEKATPLVKTAPSGLIFDGAELLLDGEFVAKPLAEQEVLSSDWQGAFFSLLPTEDQGYLVLVKLKPGEEEKSCSELHSIIDAEEFNSRKALVLSSGQQVLGFGTPVMLSEFKPVELVNADRCIVTVGSF